MLETESRRWTDDRRCSDNFKISVVTRDLCVFLERGLEDAKASSLSEVSVSSAFQHGKELDKDIADHFT